MITKKWHFRILSVVGIIALSFITPCQYTLAQSQPESLHQDYSSLPAASKKNGTININPEPDEIKAPWSITGPNKYSNSGAGDQVLTNLKPGSYTLTWGEVEGWVTPSPNPETQYLTAGDSIKYTGIYSKVPEPPSVATGPPTDITARTVVLNGKLTGLGGYISTDVSFEWGTAPGVFNNTTPVQTKTLPGEFSEKLINLSASTTYYFRAKAVSGKVTVYGEELSFTTLKELTSIAVTPDNSTIAKGRSQQFTATGIYSDLSAEDITNSVAWSSNDTAVAAISANTGLALGLAEGQAVISAASGNVTGSALLTVGAKILETLVITPENPVVPVGVTRQFTATGIYSDLSVEDITNSVAWSSNNTAVATIGEDTGLASGVGEGQTVISAASGNVTANTMLTVTPLRELNITVTGSGNTTPPVGIHIYSSGANVTIAALPSDGWAFENWTGDVDDNTSSDTTVTMDSDKTVTANFIRISATLDLAVSGNGSTDPATGSHTYAIGATIEIKAFPAAGYMFVNWTGDTATVADVGSADTTILIGDDYALTANFTEIQTDDGDDGENDGSGGGGTAGGTGGGGGSSGSNGKTITSLRGSSSATGIVWADIRAMSMDMKAVLEISYGTKCTNANGNALTSVTITEITGPGTAQAGVTVIGKVYEFGPKGAGFDPPILLTIKYNEADIPAGMLESSLGIAFREGDGGIYEVIDCRVDTETNKITALISHFSQYAIISVPRPAEFVLSGLSISPASVKPGDTVNIGITVSNTGDVEGNYEIGLLVDGISTQTLSGSLSGGAGETLNFSITADVPGEHTISIGDLSGIFTVVMPEENTPEAAVNLPGSSSLPVPGAAEESAPTPETELTQPVEETQDPVITTPVAALPIEKSPLFWRIIICNAAGIVIILGLLVFTVISRKRSSNI